MEPGAISLIESATYPTSLSSIPRLVWSGVGVVFGGLLSFGLGWGFRGPLGPHRRLVGLLRIFRHFSILFTRCISR